MCPWRSIRIKDRAMSSIWGDLDLVAEEHPDRAAELIDRHPGEPRWGKHLLHGGPVHRVAEGAEATVDEDRSADRSRMTSRQLERHARPHE